jgi:hypothetical protein
MRLAAQPAHAAPAAAACLANIFAPHFCANATHQVGLIQNRHPLLELRGARGIARTCFAAARGAAAPSALLRQAKAAAAEAGALGALAELLRHEGAPEGQGAGSLLPPQPQACAASSVPASLLTRGALCSLTQPPPHRAPARRRTATNYLVLLQGGVLPPAPCTGSLCEGQDNMYARNMAGKEVGGRAAWRGAGRARWAGKLCSQQPWDLECPPASSLQLAALTLPTPSPVTPQPGATSVHRRCWSCSWPPSARCST